MKVDSRSFAVLFHLAPLFVAVGVFGQAGTPIISGADAQPLSANAIRVVRTLDFLASLNRGRSMP
jgi:hypothetical protein